MTAFVGGQGLNVFVAAIIIVASHGPNIHPFLFHILSVGRSKVVLKVSQKT